MYFKTLALLAILALEHVNGHGYAYSPRTRNWFAVEEGTEGQAVPGLPPKEYCPDCLNTNELPNGICGKPNEGASYTTYLDSKGLEMPWMSQEVYTQGQEIVVKHHYTTHHYGHISLSACNLGKLSTQECFDDPNNWLEFVSDNSYGMPKDEDYPERGYLKRGPMDFEFVFKLPDHLYGDEVLIQWRYITANSCLPEGYGAYFNYFIGHQDYNVVADDWKGPNMQTCDKYPQDGSKPDGGAPEQFWNCAEVTINAGTPTPPTPTTPPPTVGPTPTPAPIEIVPNPSGIPYPCCSWSSDFCTQPEDSFCHESQSNCEGTCNGVYRDPYSEPPPAPTAPTAPTAIPPTNIPTTGIPCCSNNFKHCITWDCNDCHESEEACSSAGDYYWMPWGEPLDDDSCIAITYSCVGHNNECCPGMICNPNSASAPCIVDSSAPVATPVSPAPADNETPQPVSSAPVVNDTPQPVDSPTSAPVSPNNGGKLFSTDNTLSAWNALLEIDSLTNVVSSNPPVYSLLASGGAAGSGDVVSEGQAYGMLISAIVLASWDSHSIGNSEADWDVAVDYFEGYFNGWKTICLGSSTTAGCQSGGSFCYDSTLGGGYSICLPGWKHSGDLTNEVGTGSAPDGDVDAILAMILAIKAFDVKDEKPSWYDDLRKWADASCSSFLHYNTVVDNDHRILKLGSCWGGWEGNGNNPSYHSPGSFKVMRDYHVDFSNADRDYSLPNYGSGSLEDHWNNLIETSYKVLSATQCPDQGMVPNWARVEMIDGEIVHDGGSFTGSGTPQWEYGSEAARTTWRVAIDAALYPDDMSSASAYLNPLLSTLEAGYDPTQVKSFDTNTFSHCAVPTSHGEQEVYPFSGGWLWNAFIYAPTVSSLVVPVAGMSESVQQGMIDNVGAVLEQNIDTSYYPLCWTILSILTINGAVESSGGLLSPSTTPAPVVPLTDAPITTPTLDPTLDPTVVAPITPIPTAYSTVAPTPDPTPDPTPAPIAPSSQPYPCCGWADDNGSCGQPNNSYCQANESQCTGNCNGTWYTDPNGTTSAPVEQPSDDSGCCTWGGWSTCPDWALTSADPCQQSSGACTGCSGTWIGLASNTRKLIRGSA